MKKKSPRGVPDFARHPTQKARGAHDVPAPDRASTPAPPPPPRTKPQATSSKSGQRGK